MKFQAELKKSSQRKSASLDQTYQLVFETNNPMVLDLGKLPFNTIFKIDIDIDEKNEQRNNKNTEELLPKR